MSLAEVALEQATRVAPVLVTLALLVLTRKIHDWLGVGVGANVALEVSRVAERVVRDVGANLKPELVESVGRGTFTKDVGDKLLASAVGSMKAALSKATIAAIEKNTPSLDEHLKQAIEAEVAKQKGFTLSTGSIVQNIVTVALCFLLAGLGLSVSGCSSATPPAAAADTVERAAALAFNGAVVALEVVDAAEARYLDGIEKPTADDVAHAELRVERIKKARDALAVVRKWLEGERGTATAELGDAAELLGLVAQELQSRGVQIPKRVTDGLQLAAAFARVGAS